MSRPASVERLVRTLALMSWLRENGTADVDEVAKMLGVAEDVVRRDVEALWLAETESGRRSNVSLVDDRITLLSGPFSVPPTPLTADDALTVAAALKVALATTEGRRRPDLESLAAKLVTVLGGSIDGLTVHLPEPPHLALARQAVEERRRLSVRYYSEYRDTVSDRVVEPLRVFQAAGRWSLAVWAPEAGDGGEVRQLRVDRIRSASLLDERFEPPDVDVPAIDYTPSPDSRPVRIAIAAEHRWVIETYPVRDVEPAGSGWHVTLDVLGAPWLERLLLRLGPSASVIDPAEDRHVGRDAARRLLARYR